MSDDFDWPLVLTTRSIIKWWTLSPRFGSPLKRYRQAADKKNPKKCCDVLVLRRVASDHIKGASSTANGATCHIQKNGATDAATCSSDDVVA